MRIWVPRDAAARALGADAVAEAILAEARRRGVEVELVRNGSRGMVWLEPLVEAETARGRTAFGPVATRDVAGLFDAGFGAHPLALGPVEEIPFFARQTRLTFARCGLIDPLSLAEYEALFDDLRALGLRRCEGGELGVAVPGALRGLGGGGGGDRGGGGFGFGLGSASGEHTQRGADHRGGGDYPGDALTTGTRCAGPSGR